jgi:glyoxylase-like metal-dependent hydrolase (beta-lactamase superfamily II)
MNTTTSPHVQAFFDPATWTVSYVVYDHPGGHAAVVDSVLDYDPRSGRTRTDSADRLLAHLAEQNLKLQWILETHAHADHLSAAQHVHEQLGGKIAIGRGILRVQRTFKELFHLGADFEPDGGQFDRLLDDDESLPLGELSIHVIATPGHTSDSVTYVIDDAIFVGDTLFMPDSGSARCDFPGGDAVELYRSVRWMYTLPPATRMFLCHDYPPTDREPCGATTVAAQRAGNIHIRDGVSEQAFVQLRTRRDATLEVPNLIIPAVQVNIRAGRLPPPEANGVSYLRVPLNLIGPAR